MARPLTEVDWDAQSVLDDVARILGTPRQDLDRQVSTSGIVEMVLLMERDGRGADDPVRATTARIGDKWCTLMLMLLRSGPVRSTPLRRLVSTISGVEVSSKVMSEKLRALERDGFLSRSLGPAAQPQVTYALTDLGFGLAERVSELVMWITEAVPEIRRARDAYDVHNGC